jgi:hypothetical protein
VRALQFTQTYVFHMDGIDRLHRKVIHTRTLASSATDTIGYDRLRLFVGIPEETRPWKLLKLC